MTRPFFIRHWLEIEPAEQVRPPIMDEPFGYVAEFAAAAGLSHLRVAHLRLPPGVRSHPPIASRDEDGFFFVLEGRPDLWIDGYLHRLKEGDGVCLPSRTGIAHAMLNNSRKEVRLLFCGEGMHMASLFGHPVDRAAADNLARMGKLWTDAPRRRLGSHDGLTDTRRGQPPRKRASGRRRPDFVMHWGDILRRKPRAYPGSDERFGVEAPFDRKARLSRIGVHLEVLKPGRRTSWPHAERDEEEFVYVVSGRVDAWNDGRIAPMSEGDFIGWENGSGIAHTVINNSDEDAILIVGGEASRLRRQLWYPLHPKQNREVGERHWADHPVNEMGPHDGMPDELRPGKNAAKNANRSKKNSDKKSRR